MQGSRWMVGIVLVLGTLACGCRDHDQAASEGEAGHSPPPASEMPPRQVLERLLTTYRSARSYADDGVVRLHFVQHGAPVDNEWKSAVRFQRPGKLALDAFQAVVRCDGRELRARIEDPLTSDVDGQVLARPAPETIRLSDLASDGLLYDIISSRLQRQPIQLELLLESSGLAAAFGKDIACRRLPDAEQNSRKCFRIEVPSPGGAFVFWIDQESFLLHRLDYPAASLVPDLAQDESVTDLALWVELRGARLNPQIDDGEFTLTVPANAKRMQSFVVPPRPLPSSLFGRMPPPFYFATFSGDKLGQEDLAGKTTLLVWYRNHEACRGTLAEIAELRREFVGDDQVAFYAVSTDPTTESNDDLERTLSQWDVELPIVRDLEAFGDSAFAIEAQPTVVLLDAAGSVQVFQAGGTPELAGQLGSILRRLQAGEDVAGQIVLQHAAEQAEYERLVAAGGPSPQEVTAIPEAVIKSPSRPSKLALRKLWTCREVKSPGNIYLLPSGDKLRLAVCDGVRAMAELDEQGKLLGRYELDLPTRAAITFLRSGKDASGNLWHAAAAPLSPQVYLLNDQWEQVLAYPAEAVAAQVSDVQLADLRTDDGLTMYVGFIGDAGLHAVSLNGRTQWRNKAFANVVSVAVAPGDDVIQRRLLLTGEDGSLLGVNRFGNEQPRKTVGKWPIARLYAARFPRARQSAFVGLTGDAEGNLFAIGIDADLREHWRYPLPQGIHQLPLEPVTSGDLLDGGKGAWVFAGPDGSIHVVSEDGAFTDTWNVGEAVSGIAAARIGDLSAVIVATRQGITAWALQ